MPYDDISDLPDKVKNHLPKHAQEIYMNAFNNAYEEYKDPNKRKYGGSRDEAAARVAWSAVKKKYQKGTSGRWEKI